MAVGLLLVTHGRLGDELLDCAAQILGRRPLRSAAVGVAAGSSTEQIGASVARHLAELDDGDGVLLLVDLFGATPCNVARLLPGAHPCATVTGANLPMVVKVFNYPDLDLAALAEKALQGGREGVQRMSDLEF